MIQILNKLSLIKGNWQINFNKLELIAIRLKSVQVKIIILIILNNIATNNKPFKSIKVLFKMIILFQIIISKILIIKKMKKLMIKMILFYQMKIHSENQKEPLRKFKVKLFTIKLKLTKINLKEDLEELEEKLSKMLI